MNGRLYDPAVGRFFSPDNYVQLPDNPQSYNRYSYCLNNPLKYTDPSGQWLFAAVYAAVVSAFAHCATLAATGNAEHITFGSVSVAFISGGISGGISAGLLTVNGFAEGALIGGFQSFVYETVGSLIRGCKFNDAVEKGFSAGLFGAISNGLRHGFKAKNEGRDFFSGELESDEANGVAPVETLSAPTNKYPMTIKNEDGICQYIAVNKYNLEIYDTPVSLEEFQSNPNWRATYEDGYLNKDFNGKVMGLEKFIQEHFPSASECVPVTSESISAGLKNNKYIMLTYSKPTLFGLQNKEHTVGIQDIIKFPDGSFRLIIHDPNFGPDLQIMNYNEFMSLRRKVIHLLGK